MVSYGSFVEVKTSEQSNFILMSMIQFHCLTPAFLRRSLTCYLFLDNLFDTNVVLSEQSDDQLLEQT
jgi:hypothetical protein